MYRNVHYSINSEWHGVIWLSTWDPDGNRVEYSIPHRSWLYYEDNKGGYSSIYRTKLKKIEFDSVASRKQWLKKNPQTRVFECLPPVREFLIKEYEDTYKSLEFTQFQLNTVFFDIEIAVEDCFPQPDVAEYPINVMTFYSSISEEYDVWVIGRPNIKKIPKQIEQHKINFHIYEEETEMLEDFLEWFSYNRPDVLTGWNIDGFDIPYLINRMKRFIPEFKIDSALSPVNEVRKVTKMMRNSFKKQQSYKIAGVTILDYLTLYRDKFKQEKQQFYSLDHISLIETGTGKLPYDYETIKEFYQNDFEKFILYNIVDVQRVIKIDDKMQYINLARTICNMGLCEYEGILKSSPYIFGVLVLAAHDQDMKILSDDRIQHHGESFEGGHVKQTVPGYYRNGLASVDFNSLYPNTIITCNISPETKFGKIANINEKTVMIRLENGMMKELSIEDFQKILETKLVLAKNKVLYYKPELRKGIIPEFLEKGYDKRKSIKKQAKKLNKEYISLKETRDSLPPKMLKEKGDEIDAVLIELKEKSKLLDSQQYAYKILLNTVYGQLGNEYFPIYDVDNAEAVTLTGQFLIKESMNFIEKYIKETYNSDDSIQSIVVAGDTDSTVFETLIQTNKGIMKIGDLFNFFSENHKVEITPTGHEMIKTKTLKVLNKVGDKVGDKADFVPVKHLIRHKVSKKKWKIKVDGKEIILTEDHGCMVVRDGNLIKVKPKEILSTDKMIIAISFTNYKICDIESVECIGEFEDEYVFDIEVDDDSHTFFANDILIHNSAYFITDPITKKLFGTTDVKWTNKNVKIICKEIDNFVEIINKKVIDVVKEVLYSPLECVKFKRETFCSEADFLAKKHYVLHVRDDEGIIVDKWKYVGVDVKKQEIPDTIKDILKTLIERGMIENFDSSTYRELLLGAWEKFRALDDPKDLAFIKNYSTAKEVLGFMKCGKGAQTHARASIYYNQLIEKLNIKNKYDEINQSDRMRYFHVKPNEFSINAIGFKTDYPKEFKEFFQIDYETMFKKIVLSPMKGFEKNHKWVPIIPGAIVMTDIESL